MFKPYHYYQPALVVLFLLGTLSLFGQDKGNRDHPKDTVFPRVDSLKAAIVTANLRPKVKGDTTEYNTDHIRLRPNANVEELLGRLPGLQIDPNGNITYNGEKIQHLLVDGEDIFSNSPTLVTRNFDASKIARVQVLDRKSDQAIFTGIDDGTRTKTLNLVLKESAKDGYFGKVEAGGNTDGYYSGNAALAAFKGKEQFTALGLASNTGVLGFSSNAGGTSAGVGFQGGTADPLGASAGTGIPQFAGVALHYANTWNGPQDHLVGNYQYSHYFTRPVTDIQSVQTQPNSVYGQNQQNHSVNRQDQHWFYGTYDWTTASAGIFRINIRGNAATGTNQFFSNSSAGFNDTLVNSSERRINDQISQKNLGGDLNWRMPIRRPERLLSAGVSLNKVSNTTDGYLYSLNQFYTGGSIQSMDTVDQRKHIISQPFTFSASVNYTEPIWSGAVLAGSYGLSAISNESLQATYNRGDGKYLEMVDSLSSHFQSQTVSQRGILNLQGKLKHLSYTIGSDWILFDYRQKDVLADSTLRQHYFNWAPRAMMSYTSNSNTSFRLYYTASTQQPSIAQLQPVKNNNDPLHITLGNPGLRPATNQNLSLGFQRLKTWMLKLDLNLTLMNNSISTKTITDSLGRQISQPVNVDGGRSTTMNVSVNRKILGFDAGFHGYGNYSRNVSYVNADLSQNNTILGGGGFNLSRNEPDKYNLQLYTNVAYFHQESSINTTAPIHYWSQNHYGALTIFLIKNYEINTTASYTWQEKTSAFASNTSVLLWGGYISRNLLDNRLVIRAQINNLLNANAGISRTNANNVNTETSTNILGRYWMLSVIYHFDKKFKQK